MNREDVSSDSAIPQEIFRKARARARLLHVDSAALNNLHRSPTRERDSCIMCQEVPRESATSQ
eukprot:9494488-Pyramimonas_sp.AAC.1